jgi:hypothetical protein
METVHRTDGSIVIEGGVTIKKLGNRDTPEGINQEIKYTFTGNGGPLELNKPFFVTKNGYFFQTSKVRSIYIHGSEENDKLVLPKDFPVSKDLSLPSSMKEGELLLATMNSIYYISDANLKTKDCY